MPEPLVKVWLDTHVDLEPEGGQWYDAGQHFVTHEVADKLAQHGATFPDRVITQTTAQPAAETPVAASTTPVEPFVAAIAPIAPTEPTEPPQTP